jgi:tetratricopeptide (TPR) repeat protein
MKILETLRFSLNAIEKFTIYITLFLLPLMFLTNFENIFETSKLLVLVAGTSIVLVIKIVKSIFNKGLQFNSSKFDLPVLGFALVFLLSGIIASPNKVDSFFLPGTATFAIVAGIYFFLVNQLPKNSKNNIQTVLLTSGFILATLQLTAFLGITKLIPFLPEFMKVNYFTPYGNILNSIVFLVALVPMLLEKMVKGKDIPERILSVIVSLIFLISISTSIYLILPGKTTSPTILGYKYSWSIAVDSLKSNPLLGVGPGNYREAFSRFRPIEFNSASNWNVKYLQGSSSLMTIFTEIGILGLLTFVILFTYLLKDFDLKKPLYISLLVLILSQIFLPMSASFLPVLFVVFALHSETSNNKVAFFTKRYAIILSSLPIGLLLISLIYLFSQAFYSELLYLKSIKSINSGDGLKAYELINKSISINQYADKYHLLAASINLAIAENIAKKENLSDSDKETISKLVQQAIAEGKAGVTVNPKKSVNWEALSGIYQTIIAFAKGSDQFAIQSLNQAISFDPTNPLLRIRLGGLYYSLGNYESAIEVFKLAVLAKPDFANSHYNLALAYKQNKQLDKAKEQMEAVLKLVDPNSKDYELAKKELDALNTEKEVTPTGEESLTTPEPTPAPEIDPQLELPQE